MISQATISHKKALVEYSCASKEEFLKVIMSIQLGMIVNRISMPANIFHDIKKDIVVYDDPIFYADGTICPESGIYKFVNIPNFIEWSIDRRYNSIRFSFYSAFGPL